MCSLVLEADAGLSGLGWLGRADEGRVALVEGTGPRCPFEGPFAVAVVWVRGGLSLVDRLTKLADTVLSAIAGLGSAGERTLVLTNLDASDKTRWAPKLRTRALASARQGAEGLVMWGARELGDSLDRNPELRAAMPSVLGLRDLGPLISTDLRVRSSFDLNRAEGLAKVFWPTRAYARARQVLADHRFVVLTGPPEMGKTSIAAMLALAQMTCGWEAQECSSPDQVWRAFDPRGRQVFIADDAFGSTEYRPDTAERWAAELGRLLPRLDERHWLIWTSRPAPLKAGLRRVHRDRGSERFPTPGEVLVDASDLDLVEKTLILFRHVKAHDPAPAARFLVRAVGAEIVEHPHFTPERIRRFVAGPLDELASLPMNKGRERVRQLIAHELASPTEAMRASYEALAAEHRELLIAMLDAPAGRIGERELAAAIRRHRPPCPSRSTAELVDRLTDHFLRVTASGIDWVHPSWRDVAIDELRVDDAARRRFLAACGVEGAMLALSAQGGATGERSLPLLASDSDWDLLGDRIYQLGGELDDQDLSRLLLAMRSALGASGDRAVALEAESLARSALSAARSAWDKQHRVLPNFLLEAWFALNERLDHRVESPALGVTWMELHPSPPTAPSDLTRSALTGLDEWLELAQMLQAFDSRQLAALGFYDNDSQLLRMLVRCIASRTEPGNRSIAASALRRIRSVAPDCEQLARRALIAVRAPSEPAADWFASEDIGAPPTTDPISAPIPEFLPRDISRVLNDL